MWKPHGLWGGLCYLTLEFLAKLVNLLFFPPFLSVFSPWEYDQEWHNPSLKCN